MTIPVPGLRTITNEYPNPSFRYLGGPLELRRNYSIHPKPLLGVQYADSNFGDGGTGTIDNVLAEGPMGTEETIHRISWTTAPTGGSYGPTQQTPSLRSPVTFVEGDVVRVSVWFRYTGTDPISPFLRIYTYDSAGVSTGIASFNQGWINVDSGWTLYTASYTLPTNAAYVGWWIYLADTTFGIVSAGSSMEVAGVLITVNDLDTTYFDGSISYDPDPDKKVSWTGDTGLSASTLSVIPIRDYRNYNYVVGWSSEQGDGSLLRIPDIGSTVGEPIATHTGPWNGTLTKSTVVAATMRPQVILPKNAYLLQSTASPGVSHYNRFAQNEDRVMTSGMTNGYMFGSDAGATRKRYWSAVLVKGVDNPVGVFRHSTIEDLEWGQTNAPARAAIFDGLLNENQCDSIGAALIAPIYFDQIENQSFTITAVNAGQTLYFNGKPHSASSRDGQRLTVKGTGNVGLSPGYWDEVVISEPDYRGPYFDGSSSGVVYDGQSVTTSWAGTPYLSASIMTTFETLGLAPTADWGSSQARRWSIGVDRVMAYTPFGSVAWPGVVNISPAGNDSETVKKYLDGQLFDISLRPENYSASLEAFSFPAEVAMCMGERPFGSSGIIFSGQAIRPFGLCYRTMDGDGEGMSDDYTLHFAPMCYATPSGSSNQTINESPEAGTRSFEINAVDVNTFGGFAPSGHFSLSSRNTSRPLLRALERVLYGHQGSTPSLPSAYEIFLLLSSTV